LKNVNSMRFNNYFQLQLDLFDIPVRWVYIFFQTYFHTYIA